MLQVYFTVLHLQQKIIEQMRRWKDRAWSNQKIADRLNDHGVKTPTGKGKWYRSRIDSVLKRK